MARKLPEDLGLRLIAVCRPVASRNIVGIKHLVPTLIDSASPGMRAEDGDIWTCFGPEKSYRDMFKRIN